MSIPNIVTFPDKQTIINHFDTHPQGFLVNCLMDNFPKKEKIAEAFQNKTMLPEEISDHVKKVFLLENKMYANLNPFSKTDEVVPALLNKIAREEKEIYVYIWLAYTKTLTDLANQTPAPKITKEIYQW